MEDAICILCGQKKFSRYLNVECKYTKEQFMLKQCSCSLVLTSPRPLQSEIQKYYDSSSYLPHSNVYSRGDFLNKIFKKISYFWKFRLIKKYIEDDIKLLDIGGGDGSLAIYLKNKVNKVDVYEKDQSCVDFINKNNIFSTNNC